MENKKLNEQESLELITQMIQSTQQRWKKIHAIPFLIFGYITVLISLIVWYMIKTTLDAKWNFLWLGIPVIGSIFLFFLKRKTKRKAYVHTFVDSAVDYVWIVCGGAAILISFTPNIPDLFIIALLISMGTVLTGLITKMHLLTVFGSIGILAALGLSFLNGSDSILFFAAISVVMMIIPGHILYHKGRK